MLLPHLCSLHLLFANFLFFSSFSSFSLSLCKRNRNGQSHTHIHLHTAAHSHDTLNRTHFRRLRTELQLIRHKGAIKINGGIGGGGGGSLDRPNIETYLTCARCCTELGRIINRGAPCRVCRLRVCKGCREFSTHTTDWVCIVCHKQM